MRFNRQFVLSMIRVDLDILTLEHKGLGLPQVERKVLKKELKKITALKKVLKKGDALFKVLKKVLMKLTQKK